MKLPHGNGGYFPKVFSFEIGKRNMTKMNMHVIFFLQGAAGVNKLFYSLAKARKMSTIFCSSYMTKFT